MTIPDMTNTKKKRVFVSVNDPSADVHCGNLISALKKLDAGIEFVGIGGPKMAAAGCEVIESTVGRAVMTYTAIAHVGHFYKLVRRVRRYLQEHPVDLMIVCDSPSFNFHVAKAARRAGVKTLSTSRRNSGPGADGGFASSVGSATSCVAFCPSRSRGSASGAWIRRLSVIRSWTGCRVTCRAFARTTRVSNPIGRRSP